MLTVVGWLQPSGSLPHCLWRHQVQGPAAALPSARPALAERQHWVSVTSSQAMRGLCVGMYLSCRGNSERFRNVFLEHSILEQCGNR